MKKELYTVFIRDSNNVPNYVYEIVRNGDYKTEDMESAIKFDSCELAYMIRDYLNRRNNTKKYQISCIRTEEIIITDNESEEELKEE